MRYLLDTCVLSEFTKPKPAAAAIDWLKNQDEQKLYICALNICELKRGIERLASGERKAFLQYWLLDSVIQRFGERMLAFDSAVAMRWGLMQSGLEKIGKPMPIIDSLIAATALQHDCVVVTRNTQDFMLCGATVINPWVEN